MLNKMWSLTSAVILALLMVWVWAYPKFWAGYEVHPVFGWSELLSGFSAMDPYVRWAAGAVTLASIVMLFIARTRMLGALLAAALSVFFLALHSTPWLGLAIPSHEALVNGLAAGLSAEQIRAMSRGEDLHLVMTLVNGLMAAVVIAAEYALRHEAREAKQPRTTLVFG